MWNTSLEPGRAPCCFGSVGRRLPSSCLSFLLTWTAKRKDPEGHNYSCPWWELLFCEALWSAAILLGARRCWQSQRLALNPGVGVALSEAAQLLGTCGVMKPWMGISLSYLWPFSLSGYRAGFREASGAREGQQGATLRCVGGRARGPLEFLCHLRMPCQSLTLPQRKLGPIWCAHSPPLSPALSLGFLICEVGAAHLSPCSDEEVWGAVVCQAWGLGQDPSVEVGPPCLGTVPSTSTHQLKANGIITSLDWNLQWLRFALQIKSKLLSQVHRLRLIGTDFVLASRPSLPPCALSLWPSQLLLPL